MPADVAATTPRVTLRPRPVAASVDELLAGVTRREPFVPADARSPARFERVWLDGVPHVVKYVHRDDDFAMRSHADVGCVPLRVWAAGLMDVAAEVIDHTVVGVAPDTERGSGAAILMRDAAADLVPIGDSPISAEQQATFLDHLAAQSALFWGWRDDMGLLPYADRWRMFSRPFLEAERRRGWPEPIPQLAADGWERFAELAPRDVADGVSALLDDVTPLATALAATPGTFLHGDWKLGNMGSGADGRTVLVDWAYCGEGPVCHELAWYLALNRARIPVGETRESTIETLRSALERRGVATAGWWDRQLDLCLLGGTVLFGWAAAYGPDAEREWWCERARAGLARL
jgi:hypothetical protein